MSDHTTAIDIPDHFLCPITQEIMANPIRTESGHSFERKALYEWVFFGSNPTCPLSRKPLHPSNFVRDLKLEREIQQWKLLNKMPLSNQEDDDDTEAEEEEVVIVPATKKTAQQQQESILEHLVEGAKLDKLMSIRDRVLYNRERRIASYNRTRGGVRC